MTVLVAVVFLDDLRRNLIAFGFIEVIDGHVFVLVDGKLVLEVTDPDPIDGNLYGKIGFEAYCSQLKFKNLCIKKVTYTPDPKEYVPEF